MKREIFYWGHCLMFVHKVNLTENVSFELIYSENLQTAAASLGIFRYSELRPWLSRICMMYVQGNTAQLEIFMSA